MTIQCYAQRLLNPFRGLMNVIEYQAAEAVSTDGLHWDIYVSNSELVRDMKNRHRIQISDIRYGSWSKQQGLKRGPIYPSEDFRILEQQGSVVLEYLLAHHEDIPFPLMDRYELWLLGRDDQPMALLNSAIRERDMALDQLMDWRAGIECREAFHYPGIANLVEDETTNSGTYLTRYINQLAKETPRAEWFYRHEDGSGTSQGGINLDNSNTRTLSAAEFPDYVLRTSGHDTEHTALIHAFHDWLAPCLLLLDLPGETRKQLEPLARKRALSVEKHHRFYPRIMDPAQINAACVEARLRKTSGANTADEADIMSTFYIELNPGPTD